MMIKRIYQLSILLPILCLACSIQPTIKEISVDPAVVKPGDKGKILATFNGASDKIESVEATVRENPEMTFRLNDEGMSGDVEAGDGIWSYEVTVPFDATPGVYHLDFTALDNEGNVIHPKGAEEENSNRSGSVEVRVR